MGVKEGIKKAFPNVVGIIKLLQEKRLTRNLVKIPMSLEESGYPPYLMQFYEQKTGHKLNLDKPQRFTEKIQWRKLNDKDEIYTILSDKYCVREWVKKKIGEKYLIPILGHWNHFNEIDFDILPNQFVLKTNNGSHENMIIQDKRMFLRGKWAARKTMEYWLSSPKFYGGLELHYTKIQPLILAEEYLKPAKGRSSLTDYKFHCFCGKPFMCEVIDDRTTNEVIDFYDMHWHHLSVSNPPYPLNSQKKPKPDTYEEMINLASVLSQGFQYVRVDLYSTDRVYFGEMTFTPGNGTDKYEPDDWDYQMGKLWDIHATQIDHKIVMCKADFSDLIDRYAE